MALYRFVEWRDETGAVVGTSPALTFTLLSPKVLTAYYEEVAPPRYTLDISSAVGGSTNPEPGIWEYDADSVATVQASPDPDYFFHHWLLDSEEHSENPINIVMNQNYTLHAFFSAEPPPTPPPPIDLPVIAGAALAVADAALVGIYLATVFGLI